MPNVDLAVLERRLDQKDEREKAHDSVICHPDPVPCSMAIEENSALRGSEGYQVRPHKVMPLIGENQTNRDGGYRPEEEVPEHAEALLLPAVFQGETEKERGNARDPDVFDLGKNELGR